MTENYTFPITFDIDKPSSLQKTFGCVVFLVIMTLSIVIISGAPKLLIAVLAFVLSLVVAVIVVARENLNKPAFTILEDRLIVKKDFGRMKEYPFEMFNKDVYVKKVNFEWFIVLPDNIDRIHIHSLPSERRDKMLSILKELVEKEG